MKSREGWQGSPVILPVYAQTGSDALRKALKTRRLRTGVQVLIWLIRPCNNVYPMKLEDAEFDRIVKKAIRRVPPVIKPYLKNILISVRKRPTQTILREVGLPPGSLLFGLYRGVPLTERSPFWPPLYPDTIMLFQEPLEEVCQTMEQLEKQIIITLVHEVAHFAGMSEERLRELGYG